ncbi:GMC oxidoreductase [Methylobacterium gossipiicola]|uniref:Choline dehydrogenase n=1 Tax=Methylobacterium gossipiicola TaxID=582675 RepID=A0A1I2RXM9_9HYPH|nr:GMC family oxidoreductase [Methylobacterium gossipiicola]SFG45318.1 Choline dehydrogenase [Methylobacterium gossipiicola]
MILNQAELGAAGAYDVAIVGGGTAGLIVAHALSGKGLRVVVLEGGGLQRQARSQDLYGGQVSEPEIHPELTSYRVRAVGGTSRIWGGRVIPFDPIDFEARPWVPGSGWPFGFETLEPYYERAMQVLEAGRYDYAPETALPNGRREFAPGIDGPHVTTTLERFSKPTNLWRRHGAVLTGAADVHVVLDATVTALRLRPDGGGLSHLEVKDPDGILRTVRARATVLALGALETARLLLASNDVHAAGIGNAHDQVGRNYMSHLCTTAGTLSFAGRATDIAYDYERDPDGIYVRRRLWLNAEAQRRFGLLNTTFRTHLPDAGNPDHGNAILSAMYLFKSFVLSEYARKFSERRADAGGHLRHCANILRQPLRIARFGRTWLTDRILAERKLPSVVLGSANNRYVLEFHAEQAPNPDSRVTLTDRCDRLGMPQLKVDWRLCALDFDSIKGAYRLLAAELARSGVGRLDYDEDELIARTRRHGIVGGHQIGTTRMADDPRQGVVDRDCRVHGTSDLYVASASVFPSSGQANPTHTIAALGLRLSERLVEVLR